MWQEGDKTTTISTNASGMPVIEGEATLLKWVDMKKYVAVDTNTYYIERWTVQLSNGTIGNRWLYPQCDIEAMK